MPIDLDLFLAHTTDRSIVEVLLRGHLWVEKHLTSLLQADLAKPEALNLDRLAFSQKLKFADALGLLRPDELEAIRVLNTMRNRLAHDLRGSPNASDVDRLMRAMPESQQDLAEKLLASVGEGQRGGPEGESARLAAAVLALLTELEQHSQWHAYWREHRSALEAYRLMVSVMERRGLTPETEEAYRTAIGIPDPPTPKDAIARSEQPDSKQ